MIVQGDALTLPLPDESVDLVVTSPPYFALRSYRDDDGHYEGQIGSEDRPEAWLAALWAVMDELWRVLKPEGSVWVNLGDKYVAGTAAGGPGPSAARQAGLDTGQAWHEQDRRVDESVGCRTKSLMGLPWWFALGCTMPDRFRDGGGPQWILRAEVIWSKPNGLPESARDRVRRSHEQWFHFTRQGRYYTAIDEIREPQMHPNHSQIGSDARGERWNAGVSAVGAEAGHGVRPSVRTLHPLGKLPGSVWEIPSEPLIVPEWAREKYRLPDHFAAFPQEWPRRIITGWSPPGICEACGEGRRPDVEKAYELTQATNNPHKWDGGEYVHDEANMGKGRTIGSVGGRARSEATITGYSCGCPDDSAPTRPAVVLDPFVGTGTTVMVARALGRAGVGVDLSHAYCRLARWRVFESGHASKSRERCNLEAQGSLGL